MHYNYLVFALSITFTVEGFTSYQKRSVRTFSLDHFHGRNDNDDEEELLIPTENPTIDPNTKSSSGVTFGKVLAGLNKIYPPNELSQRNAISRTDGYWSFIEAGEKPPQHFTYGEFDFLFFAELIEKSIAHHNNYYDNQDRSDCTGKTFLDIGSGTGRLVIGAAALHSKLKQAKGLEILPGIYEASLKNLEKCRKVDESENTLSLNPDNIDKDEKESDNYEIDGGEPFCEEMNEMQEALQGMTAEEWKAILGDLDLDEDLLEDENDDDNNDEYDERSLSQINDLDDQDNLSTVDEGSTKTAVELARMQEHNVTANFVLSSDETFVSNLENDICHTAEQYFESLERFIEFEKSEWDEIFGEYSQNFDPTQTNSTASVSLNSANDAAMDETYALNSIDEESTDELPLAPINFSCGSFQDPYEYIGDADIIFVFSSCMKMDMIDDLSKCLGRCRQGTIVITTEFMLEKSGYIDPLDNDPEMSFGEYEIELVETVEGFNWITDKSTAYIQRVTKSVWDGLGPKVKPIMKPEEVAFQTIKDMEAGNLTDVNTFLRRVRNNMAFVDLEYVNDLDVDADADTDGLLRDEIPEKIV